MRDAVSQGWKGRHNSITNSPINSQILQPRSEITLNRVRNRHQTIAEWDHFLMDPIQPIGFHKSEQQALLEHLHLSQIVNDRHKFRMCQPGNQSHPYKSIWLRQIIHDKNTRFTDTLKRPKNNQPHKYEITRKFAQPKMIEQGNKRQSSTTCKSKPSNPLKLDFCCRPM